MQQTGRKSRVQRIRSDFWAIVKNISDNSQVVKARKSPWKNQKTGQVRWIAKLWSGTP